MHELSLSSAIVATVERHAGGRPVEVVNLRIGRLRQVAPESLRFYFGFVARGTVCERAQLRIEALPALLRCEPCGREFELEEPRFACRKCGSTAVVVAGGDELEIESILVEEEEACTARS
jgi:hydrogenase nickel incorporation protein HypA/HybF